jgi:hypothetical protein
MRKRGICKETGHDRRNCAGNARIVTAQGDLVTMRRGYYLSYIGNVKSHGGRYFHRENNHVGG